MLLIFHDQYCGQDQGRTCRPDAAITLKKQGLVVPGTFMLH